MSTGLPTPYFQRDDITIYHADCRDILPLLEPGSVDLVLTDPPFGKSLDNHGRNDGRRSDRSWSIIGDDTPVIGQWAIDVCNHNSWPLIAFASPTKPWSGNWRQHLVWDKGPAVGGGGDIATCWKFTWELIQVARNKAINGPRDCAVLKFWVVPQDSIDHPAQKPEDLIRYLIAKSSAESDLVLDPFMGSGTTLRAAMDLGRSAIGIEIEERYCEIAARRLQQAVLPGMAGVA